MTGGRWRVWLSGAILALLATGAAHAAGSEGGHADPFAPILLELAVVVLAVVLGRRAAGLVGQPAVLGELVIGVVIGNVGYWLGVITDGFFSAVVIMAMLTTMMTPIALKWSLSWRSASATT